MAQAQVKRAVPIQKTAGKLAVKTRKQPVLAAGQRTLTGKKPGAKEKKPKPLYIKDILKPHEEIRLRRLAAKRKTLPKKTQEFLDKYTDALARWAEDIDLHEIKTIDDLINEMKKKLKPTAFDKRGKNAIDGALDSQEFRTSLKSTLSKMGIKRGFATREEKKAAKEAFEVQVEREAEAQRVQIVQELIRQARIAKTLGRKRSVTYKDEKGVQHVITITKKSDIWTPQMNKVAKNLRKKGAMPLQIAIRLNRLAEAKGGVYAFKSEEAVAVHVKRFPKDIKDAYRKARKRGKEHPKSESGKLRAEFFALKAVRTKIKKRKITAPPRQTQQGKVPRRAWKKVLGL